jgi:hypothetical protein
MKLTALQLEQIKRIETILTNMGCSFEIHSPDGVIFGGLKKVNGTGKRAKRRYPYGEVRGYIRPYIENVADGEAVKIPYGKYTPGELQSCVSSYLSSLWGPKTYITSQLTDADSLEVLRTGGI